MPDQDQEMRPRLLREIPEGAEDAIDETVRELRMLFPSYRDDQLLVFWLGRLIQKGIDVHDFDSSVSFKH